MRPEIDADDDLRQQVREYAKQRGLLMCAAWARLVERGLEAVDE